MVVTTAITVPAARWPLLCLCLLAANAVAVPCRELSAQAPAPSQSDTKKPEAAAPAQPGPVALPHYPLDVVISPAGDAIIVDRNLPGLWKKSSAGAVEVFVKGSNRYRQPLNAARCLALDKSGQVLVGDSGSREIYRIDDQGQPQPMTGGAIGIPMDIALRADGSLMVADLETRTLLHVSADGKEVKTVAKVNPRGVFVDKEDKVWVVSQDPQQLQVVADDGTSKAIVDKRTFEFPHQVVVDDSGTAYVTDGYKKAVWKVVPGSAPQVHFSGAPLDNPVGIALYEGGLLVTDPRARKVFRIQDGKCEPWIDVP